MLNLCKIQNFIQIGRFAIFGPKLWKKGSQVPIVKFVKFWPQVSNLTGVENHKKLLLLLNSPPSTCVSKLIHLLFLIQNFHNHGLTDDRCLHWQISIFTGVKTYKKIFVTIEFTTLHFCRVRNFIKIEAFAALRPKLWPERWHLSPLAGVKNHTKLLSSMNSVPSNCSLCKISWKMVSLIPRSPFLIPFFKDSLFWIEIWLRKDQDQKYQE